MAGVFAFAVTGVLGLGVTGVLALGVTGVLAFAVTGVLAFAGFFGDGVLPLTGDGSFAGDEARFGDGEGAPLLLCLGDGFGGVFEAGLIGDGDFAAFLGDGVLAVLAVLAGVAAFLGDGLLAALAGVALFFGETDLLLRPLGELGTHLTLFERFEFTIYRYRISCFLYRVSHLLVDLTVVEFDLGVPVPCSTAKPFLPNSKQPERNLIKQVV